MRNSNERVRFRYGICLNESCEKCKSKEVQEIPARKDFVCTNPECGKPLRECPPPKKGPNKTLIAAIIGGVAVIGIAAALIFSSGGEATQEPQTDPTAIEKAVVDSDSIKAAKLAEEQAKAEKEKAEQAKPEKVEKAEKAVPVQAPKAKDGYGKVNLGYGTYEGYLRNGKPHGHGTITYTRMHKIVSWRNFEASSGDTFEGEFRDGQITGLGYWRHDGNVTAIQ